MPNTDVSSLSMLGKQTEAPTSPETAVLEKVPASNAGTDYVVRFTAPEFTSLCPMTGSRISPISSSITSRTNGWWNPRR